jgi:glycosyltransferase involved in cell wall biosynthesis
MSPLVSVVIPTKNRRNIVVDAIRSVLNQDYSNYEIIVSDDCSVDNTVEYLKSLNLPIKIIENETKGASHTRNAGIKAAKGEFISFLDSDDVWLPSNLSEQVDYITKHPDIGLVYTDQYIESGGKILKMTRFKGEAANAEQKKRFNLPWCIIPQAPVHTSAIMVRKSIFDTVGLFNEDLQIHEDSDMWNRISEVTEFGFIEKPLSIFRWEKDPEHILKPGHRRPFVSEARKYLKLYEDRQIGTVISQEEREAIEESYRRIDALDEIVDLWEKGTITEEEFHKRRQAIFHWYEYE